MSSFIDKHIKWVFSLPTLIFMLIMVIAPLGVTFGLSLTDWNLLTGNPPVFNYGANYKEMLSNKEFWDSCFITFYYTILATGLEIILGLIIALILNTNFRFKNAVKTVILLPFMMAPVAVGLMWILFYEPTSGIINYVFNLLGLPMLSFTASRATVIPSIAVVEIWQMTPMVVIICLAGLSAIPSEPYESAKVDGANAIQIFKNVTLPALAPTLYAVTLLRFIDVFKSFDLIYSMSQGGPANASRTLHLYAYELAFNYSKFGMSSTALTLLFGIVLLVTIIIMAVQKRGEAKW